MKQVVILYRKMKLQNKILSTYLLFTMIILMSFFLLTNQIVIKNSHDASMFSAVQSMEQTQLYANQKLYNATKLLNTVLVDQSIYEIVMRSYGDEEILAQYQMTLTIDSYFTGVEENNEIAHISIYMPEKFSFINGGEIRSFESLQTLPWYEDVVSNSNRTLCAREQEDGRDYITIGRLMYDKHDINNYIGAIKIFIDEGIYREFVNNCVTTMGGICYITNEEGEVITASAAMTDEHRIAPHDIQKNRVEAGWTKMISGGEPAFIQAHALEYSDWYLVNIIPQESIHRESRRLTMAMAAFMLLLFVVAYALAFLFSKSMVGRVVKLNRQMIASRRDSFQPVDMDAPHGSKDEIDMLSESYNDLVHRIELYARAQAEQSRAVKSAELKVLQEQLNPHFLYNVLDLIVWMAIKKDYNKIVNVVRSLAEFYKIGLHRGGEVISVAKEMEHLTFYMAIQRIRYENLQEPEFHISEELMECTMQKNLLLPLVENAINHGLRDEESEGRIIISAQSDGGDIVFCVRDNGAGIAPDVIQRLEEGTYEGKNGGGFGIKNLNERIRLYYGAPYGLSFGDCGAGGMIYVRIPKISTHS